MRLMMLAESIDWIVWGTFCFRFPACTTGDVFSRAMNKTPDRDHGGNRVVRMSIFAISNIFNRVHVLPFRESSDSHPTTLKYRPYSRQIARAMGSDPPSRRAWLNRLRRRFMSMDAFRVGAMGGSDLLQALRDGGCYLGVEEEARLLDALETEESARYSTKILQPPYDYCVRL